MSRRRILIGVPVLLALLGAAIVLWFLVPGSGSPRTSPTLSPPMIGGTVPADAFQTAHDLVSGIDGKVRAALTPALAAQMPAPGTMARPGTRLDLDARSWNQQGDFASATGRLTSPGRAPERILVGFVHSGGRWRVTITESLR
jgi:hypothetical protein